MRINGLCLVNLGPMRDDGVQGWLAVNAIEQCIARQNTGQVVNAVPVGTETLPVL